MGDWIYKSTWERLGLKTQSVHAQLHINELEITTGDESLEHKSSYGLSPVFYLDFITKR